MSIERVRAYFDAMGMAERIWEFDGSSATVELAAQALAVRPARIAKTLSFRIDEGCALVVTAGDARIDNHKFKERFHTKAKMLAHDEVEAATGSAVGGVCPFALPKPVPVYLDVSLRRFTTVFPACGSDNSAIELTCDELFRFSGAEAWIDVCKDWAAGDDPVIDDTPRADLPDTDDGVVRLSVERVCGYDEKRGYVPAYWFGIRRISDNARVGSLDLRLGLVRNTYYGGNIGYAIDEPYRGHGYAERAARLALNVAWQHGLPEVTIGCDEKNVPSLKTLQKLGGELVETAPPPRYTGLYREGKRDAHCVFRFLPPCAG